MDVAGLYLSIPNGEGLTFLRTFLETRNNKQILYDTLAELEKLVLKNSIFESDEKTFKQKSEATIGAMFAPLYANHFMADFEGKMLENFTKKQIIQRRYINEIVWEHGEESLKVFIKQVNMFYSTTKFTVDYSKEEVNFLDVNIKLIDGKLKTDLFVKPTDTHQLLDSKRCSTGFSSRTPPFPIIIYNYNYI